MSARHPISCGIAEMTAQVRKINIEKGWRSAEGGPGSNSFGDYIALLHSEVSEALEAYRDHRLNDPTPVAGFGIAHPKPEGVGSELAGVLIRLVDMCDVFGIDLAQEYHRKVAYNASRAFQHGGRTVSDTGIA
jgi:NTP pyrophosphatase (non-canonical NTP hydrolase)